MDAFNAVLADIAAIVWHPYVLYLLLVTGIVFTIWSGFGQYRALTHGFQVIKGSYDDPSDPGAINHFQALSAALSGTVGLGNIAGVALAVELGGPGAVFWMWVVGILGMATKMTEVILSMLYRNTEDPDNPHGGPMWVVKRAVSEFKPSLSWLGHGIGVLFCITLLVYTITGGNTFQAWNVGEITESYFGIPSIVCGVILAIIVGLVIIGGVKRIGRVAGSLVPIMVLLYLLAAIFVMVTHWEILPSLFAQIFISAFSPEEASGAFVGGAMGSALSFGMQRALFSSEAGVGSAPIAHSAAKTDEPVREGVVAGLEPFIDTLVVCTMTALVILSSGTWERGAEATLDPAPVVQQVEGSDNRWTLPDMEAPARDEATGEWTGGENVFLVVHADLNDNTENDQYRFPGAVEMRNGTAWIDWGTLKASQPPEPREPGVFVSYPGATLTAMSFDTVLPGLGKWLVTVAVWLFAISTMITWSYYGEQGIVYLFGERAVMPYRYAYCAIIIIATLGLIETATELNNFSALGTGVMLWVNIPIMWVFGFLAMRAYKKYIRELKAGRMPKNPNAPSLMDVILGRDVR
jgi:AGCS family alanine or glycine:cation symporter